jgi:putative protease
MLVRESWPEQMPVHLSVQANTVNFAAVSVSGRSWASAASSSRANCRSTKSPKSASKCPDIELEVFVHGALCIAYSGRCLLSGYFNQRDSNQGTCTNSCRWDYKAIARRWKTLPVEIVQFNAANNRCSSTPPTDQEILLAERPSVRAN